MITVFNLWGTWEYEAGHPMGPIASLEPFYDWPLKGDWVAPPSAPKTGGISPSFEYVFVPYEGAAWPMNQSAAQGLAALKAAIVARPNNKFILTGISQGATIISDMRDELRTGDMKARYPDLLAAIAIGNPRRQKGKQFPGFTDPIPTQHGVLSPNLVNTEPFWWEMCVEGDPTSSDDTAVGEWMRTLFGVFNEKPQLALAELVEPWKIITALQNYYKGVFATGAPHPLAYYLRQPFSDKGDMRTFIQIAIDYINTFAV